MTSSTPFVTVLVHTPAWVWALLAALLVLGLAQTRPRRVSALRATLLPAAMLAWSLWGTLSSFGAGLALLAWMTAMLGAALASASLGAPAGVRWRAAEHGFDLPGSWVPMGLILAIFCIRFAVGANLAQHPGLRNEGSFAIGAGLALGALSGIFTGRALALLRVARQRC